MSQVSVNNASIASLMNIDFSSLGSNTNEITSAYLSKLQQVGDTMAASTLDGYSSLLGNSGVSSNVSSLLEQFAAGGGSASSSYLSEADKASDAALLDYMKTMDVSALTNSSVYSDYTSIINGSAMNMSQFPGMQGGSATDYSAMFGQTAQPGQPAQAAEMQQSQPNTNIASMFIQNAPGAGNAQAGQIAGMQATPVNANIAGMFIQNSPGGANAQPAAMPMGGMQATPVDPGIASMFIQNSPGGANAQPAGLPEGIQGMQATPVDPGIASMFIQNAPGASGAPLPGALNPDGSGAPGAYDAATGSAPANTNIAGMFTQSGPLSEAYANSLSSAQNMAATGNYANLYNGAGGSYTQLQDAYTGFMKSYMASMGVAEGEINNVLGYYASSFYGSGEALTGYNSGFANSMPSSFNAYTEFVGASPEGTKTV